MHLYHFIQQFNRFYKSGVKRQENRSCFLPKLEVLAQRICFASDFDIIPAPPGYEATIVYTEDFESFSTTQFDDLASDAYMPSVEGTPWEYAGPGRNIDIVDRSGDKEFATTYYRLEDRGQLVMELDVGSPYLYVSQIFRFDKNYDFGYGEKIMRVSSRNDTDASVELDFIVGFWAEANPGLPEYDMTGRNDSGELYVVSNGPLSDQKYSFGIYEPLDIVRERDYRFELVIKLNDIGIQNGTIQLSVDGRVIMNQENMWLRENDVLLDTIWATGWYTNGNRVNPSVDPTVPAIRYIDDIVVASYQPSTPALSGVLSFVNQRSTQYEAHVKLRHGEYDNEIGLAKVDDAFGRKNGLRPGDQGWIEAVLASNNVTLLAHSGSTVGNRVDIQLDSSAFYLPYVVQDASLAEWRSMNPHNEINSSPLVFFPDKELNVDRVEHFHIREFEGAFEFAAEDLTFGGDFNYTDLVVEIVSNDRVCRPTAADDYFGIVAGTGGVATLNHRLIAVTPSGSGFLDSGRFRTVPEVSLRSTTG